MAKKELFELKRWGWWYRACRCVPISKDGKNFSATKEVLRRLKTGALVAIFPEGTRSKDNQLQEAELGAGYLAVKSGAPIVPMYIHGTYEALAKEGKYKPFLPVHVYIGPTIFPQVVDSIQDRREKCERISHLMMAEIAKLKVKAEQGPKLTLFREKR